MIFASKLAYNCTYRAQLLTGNKTFTEYQLTELTFFAHKALFIVAITVIPLCGLVVSPNQGTVLVAMVVRLTMIEVGVRNPCV